MAINGLKPIKDSADAQIGNDLLPFLVGIASNRRVIVATAV